MNCMLLRERFGGWSCFDKHLGIVGDFPLAGQIQRFDLVSLVFQCLLGFRVAGPLGVGGILFAVTLNEIDLLGLGPPDLDDGVCEILFLNFFGSLFDFFPAVAVGNDHGSEFELRPGERILDRSVDRDVILLCHVGLSVRIDKFIANVGTCGPVFNEQFFQWSIVAAREKGFDDRHPCSVFPEPGLSAGRGCIARFR